MGSKSDIKMFYQCPFSEIVWFHTPRKIMGSGSQGWAEASKKFRHKTIDKDPLASARLSPLHLYVRPTFYVPVIFDLLLSLPFLFTCNVLFPVQRKFTFLFSSSRTYPQIVSPSLSMTKQLIKRLITFVLFRNKCMMQSVQCQSQDMLIAVNLL